MHTIFLALIATGVALIADSIVREPAQARLPPNYQPLHKGGVDLPTGLYVREDEDLVIGGIPPLILRRTYLAGYRISKQFGIGATHNGEIYLHGTLQKISLILAKGSRIDFEPISKGPLPSTIYAHRSGSDEWRGAQLRVGFGWMLKRRDGSEMLFQLCGPFAKPVCSILSWRGAFGETIDYRRDTSGRLTKMESGSRSIALEYDSSNRIIRADATSGASVAYEYDSAGRLARVKASDGREHLYTYTNRDELATITDPGRTIENSYDSNGRVVRQVNRTAGDPEPFIFDFTYRVAGEAVVETRTARSDGSWSRYTFDKAREVIVEDWGWGENHHGSFKYDRDPQTGALSALTITCSGRNGPPAQHMRKVVDDDLIETKIQLVQDCFSANPPNLEIDRGAKRPH